MPENVKVVIIGAGVIGMSTAVRIVGGAYDLTDTLARCSLDGDAKGAEPKEGVVTVDLIADSLSPNTTSDQAAGLCLVTELNDTDPKLIRLLALNIYFIHILIELIEQICKLNCILILIQQ